jgi:pimeloyl-ACP methyl ester carboxylesterase
VPIEGSRTLVDLLPDAELVEFEGSGHVPTMTRSREVVDAISRRFPA